MADAADNDTETAAQKVPRPLWRRVLKWLGWGLVAVLVLLCVVVALLHTGPGQRFVRDKVQDRLQERVNGEVQIEGLEFALFGDIALTGVHIRNTAGDEVITVGALDVSLAWSSLLADEIVVESVAVDGVGVHIQEYEDGTTSLTGLFKKKEPTNEEPSTLAIRLESVTVANTSLRIDRLNGNVLAFEDIQLDAEAAAALSDKAYDVQVHKFGLDGRYSSPDGRVIEVDDLAISVNVTGRGSHIVAHLEPFSTEMLVTSPTATAQRDTSDDPTQPAATQTAMPSKPLVARIAIDGADVVVDGFDIDATVHGADLGPMSFDKAVVTGTRPSTQGLSGHQHVEMANLHIDAAQLNAILGKQILASNVTVDLELDGPPENIVVTGTVKTRGGHLALSGTSNMTDLALPVYEVRLEGTDIATENLLVADIPEVHSSLVVDIKGQGAQPDDTVLDIDVAVGPTTINRIPVDGLDATVHVDRGRFEIKSLILKLFGRELKLVGELDTTERTASARVVANARFDDLLDQAHGIGIVPDPRELPVSCGNVDVDLTVSASGDKAAPGTEGPIPPEILARLPFGDMGLQGNIRLEDIESKRMSIKSLDCAVDMNVAGAHPSGTVNIDVVDLQFGRIAMARVLGDLELRDEVLHIKVRGQRNKDDDVDKPYLSLDGSARLDEATDEVVITLDVLALRGLVELEKPVTLRLPRNQITERTALDIPDLHLALAGGSVDVTGGVVVEPGEVEGSLKVVDGFANIDLSGVNISKAAGLAGRRVPVRGSLSGRIAAAGPFDDPTVDLDLRSRVRVRDLRKPKPVVETAAVDDPETTSAEAPTSTAPAPSRQAAEPLDIAIRGQLKSGRAKARIEVHSRNVSGSILELSASLPIKTEGGIKLSSGGRMEVVLDVPERTVAELAPVLPPSLIATVDPQSTVAAKAWFGGSMRKPDGRVELQAAGTFLAALNPAFADRRQAATVVAVVGEKDNAPWLQLDATTSLDERLGDTARIKVEASLNRSPFKARKLQHVDAWAIDTIILPQDLGALGLPTSEPLTGGLQANITASGQGGDVDSANISVSGTQVVYGERPPADIALGLAMNKSETALAVDAHIAGLHLLDIDGTTGVGGEGLLTTLQKKQTDGLLDAPLAVDIVIPDTQLTQLQALDVHTEMPGKVAGHIQVAGTLRTPLADGTIQWDDYTALDGRPAVTSVTLMADETEVRATVGLGGGPNTADIPLALVATLERQGIVDFVKKTRDDLTIAVTSGGETSLSRVMPSFVLADNRTVELDGRLGLDLTGPVTLRRKTQEEGGGVALADLGLSGGLELSDGSVNWVELPRDFERIAMRVNVEGGNVVIENIEAHESDLQVDDRALKVTGALQLDGVKPVSANATIELDRFLYVGPFDSPHAEFSGRIEVAADLSTDDRVIDVELAELDFHQPNRFFRGHHMEKIASHDLTYISDASQVGLLGYEGTVMLPPAEIEAARIEEAEAEAAEAAELAANPVPPKSTTINIRVPNAINVDRHPFQLSATGEIKVVIDATGTTTSGGLTAHEGAMHFMGNHWEFDHGGLTFDGKDNRIGELDLWFKRTADLPQTREIATAGWEDDAHSFLNLSGPLKKNRIELYGPGGSTFPDSASFQIAGHSQWTTSADMPGSETVRIPSGDRGLVLSYIHSNLSHMHFMDRVNAYADPYDKNRPSVPESYGQTDDAEVEVYFDDGDARLRFVGKRRDVATNRAEVQVDYLFVNGARTLFGVGARAGSRGAVGAELFIEWASEQ